MINFFQMNQTGGASGLLVSGDTMTSANGGDSLFSILLNNMNGSLENNNKSLASSLFTNTTLTNTIISEHNPGAGIALPVDNKGKLNQNSIQSSDFILPESAIPDLISFLGQKGFSEEQIDRILLSSRNDDGDIQTHKLVKSIQSVETITPSDGTGLIIEQQSVPKVQKLLFETGLGVGEVNDIVEKSGDQKGGISVDKLAEALNGQLQEPVSKIELVSFLEKQDIKVTSEEADNTLPVSDLKNNDGLDLQSSINATSRISDPVKGIPYNQGISDISLPESGLKNNDSLNLQSSINATSRISDPVKGIPYNQGISNVTGPESDVKNNIGVVENASNSASDASNPKNNTNVDLQGNDINKAAIELKKEFMDFVNGKNQGQDGAEKQEIVIRSSEKIVQTQEFKPIEEKSVPNNIVAGLAKTGNQGSIQEGRNLGQESLKGQSQWQKGNDIRAAGILNTEKSSNTEMVHETRFQERAETVKDTTEFLKQGDQNVKQEVLTGVSENKTLSKTQTSEETDIKGGILNIKETQTGDVTSQNTAKVTENMEIKVNNKTGYNLPEPLPKVFDRMVLMIKNGEQTGRVMIRPPELGKIDIDLTLKNGHIQANLNTDNFVVKEIIEANLNQLRQQLTDQGFIVEQFNVSVGSQNRQFQDNNRVLNTGNESSGSEVPEIDDTLVAMDEGIVSNKMSSRYRIDVRV